MSDFSSAQKTYMDQLFMKLITTINDKTTEIRNEFKQQITELNQGIHSKINSYEEKIAKLENKNIQLEKTILQLQRRARKNNVVIFGITSTEPNLFEYTLKLLNESLELNILVTELNDIYRVGSKENPVQPVIVEFISFQRKSVVLRNAKKLKGKNIFINQDLCYEDRIINKILSKHLKEVRSKHIQAYIKGNKLIIGSETYTVEELESNTPIHIDPQENIKPNSAPSTPDHFQRQKRLFDEFGTEDAADLEQENQQLQKKPKPSGKTTAEKSESTYIGNKIHTRSNSIATKPM